MKLPLFVPVCLGCLEACLHLGAHFLPQQTHSSNFDNFRDWWEVGVKLVYKSQQRDLNEMAIYIM